MKKILVPVDFSDYSEYALEVAAQIAKQKNMQILVLHMIGIAQSVLAKNESQEYNEAQYYMGIAKKRFSTFLNKEYLRGVKIVQLVQNYKIFSEINAIAQEQDIGLVVMGSHGESGFLDAFIGSNTEKVVRTSEVPVMVVKDRTPNFKLDSLVFAWNFKDEILEGFMRAKAFAKFFGAQISPVYVNMPTLNFLSTKELEEKIEKSRKKTGFSEKVVIYNDYTVEKGIVNYAHEINADAVVIPTHGRKGIAHFFMGSIGEDIANRADLPVITFKV